MDVDLLITRRAAHAVQEIAALSMHDCEHFWCEGVDDRGRLVEPPYDMCYHCGLRRD